MADYGIKVTRDGYDTDTIPNTAENIKKFSLLSSVNLLKISQTAKITLANGASTTIAHGFSYKPLFWVFLQNASGTLEPVYNETNTTSAYINATNLFIRNNEGGSRDFYYYIFYDPV